MKGWLEVARLKLGREEGPVSAKCRGRKTTSELRSKKWGDWWWLGHVGLVCCDEDFRLNLEEKLEDFGSLKAEA